MKTLLCIFALTSLIVLSGCTQKPAKTVVSFASWGSKSEVDILKPILSDFEKQNPTIKVEFMHIPQNYFQKIHLLYASNTAPDVIFINNLNLPIFANANCLDKISADKNIYYPQALSALSYKGNLYAIPRDVSNLVVFYNKDLFDKKGIPYPNKNWTFKDFLKTAQLLTDKNTFGVSFEENSYFFLPYLMSEGGGILSDNLTSQIIDSPQSQKGLNFYTDLRKKYHVAPRNDESASATMAQLFLQQQLGMQVSGRWLVPKYRTDAKFRWDVVNFPKGDKGSIVQMDASGWAISKSSKHKLEAKKLIDFLSSKDSSEKFAKSGLIVPARIDSANSKAFLDGKAPKNAKVFLDVIKTSKTTPVSVDYNEITDKLAKKFEIKFN